MKRLPLRFLSRKWTSMVALLAVVTFMASSTVPAWATERGFVKKLYSN